MQDYVVKSVKWDGDGAIRTRIVGTTGDLGVAQRLMIQKALTMANIHQLLHDGHVLIYKREYADTAQDIDLARPGSGPTLDHAYVLDKLIASQLADKFSVHICNGKKGFAVCVKEVPRYDSSNIGQADANWRALLVKKLQEKRKRLEHLDLATKS